MSEERKRSRKSKLVVRDDYESTYEVANGNDATTFLQKKPKIKSVIIEHPKLQAKVEPEVRYTENPALVDHDYCKPGSLGFPSPYFPHSDTFQGSSLKFMQSCFNSICTVEESDKKVNLLLPQKRRYSILRKMESVVNQVKATPKPKPEILMCKYQPDIIFHVSEKIAATSNNPADKILDIEMRNLWGSIQNPPDKAKPHEIVLQNAIESWQAWYFSSKLKRDVPLLYQCHICNVAWWRLQPFREHIIIHDISTLMVTLKESVHECLLVASDQPVNNLTFIDIDEDCWRCGRDVDFHKVNTQVYSCDRCDKYMYTCSSLIEHETICLYGNMANTNVSEERRCVICKLIISSLNLVEKHMIEAHSVRSDLPVPIMYKNCQHCKSKYFIFNTHSCIKRTKNTACKYCCRKFATKPLALAHMLSPHNKPILCRICSAPLKAKCLEMEHIVSEHSNNYQLAHKCTICLKQNVLFMDEMSIKKHRQHWHQRKFDNRRSYYETMLVPKICLQEISDQEVFESGNSFVLSVRENNKSRKVIKKKKKRVIEIYCTGSSSEPPNNKILITPEDNVLSSQNLGILSPEVDVTVDKVDVKREPVENNENEEVDYEEMLNNMFNQTNESKNKNVPKTNPTEDFDFGNVTVKTEPIDDIDITNNSVENIQIKTEPIDENDMENERMEIQSQNHESPEKVVTVKVERDIYMDDPDTNIMVFKNEFKEIEEKSVSTESIPFDQLITDLDMFKSQKDLVSKEVLNPDEMSFDVMTPSGVYKKNKVYACSKCGYTARHKQYKIHVSSNCSVSPGIHASHPCSKCGLTFVMFKNYVLHFDNHGYEHMSCPKCGDTFTTLVRLLSHVQKHIKNNFVELHVLGKGGEETSRAKKKLKCRECQSVVPREDTFTHWEAHLVLDKKAQKAIQVKEEPPELTVDCERVTMNNKQLEPAALKAAIEHLQSTSSAEKECVICYRAFSRRYDVKRHVVEHLLMDAHMKKPKYRVLRCQICFAGFSHQERYKFHMRDHGSMPIFKCELCNKTFSDSSNFAKHKKTHNVRVLICDLCNKKFHLKAALEKHIVEHDNLPTKKCSDCDKVFTTKQSYKKHKYQIHHETKFKCMLCDLAFSSLQQKWNHDWEVHKERKQAADCPICLKSFRKFQDVRVHARVEHNAEVAVIKQASAPKNNIQYFKVKDLNVKDETIVVRE